MDLYPWVAIELGLLKAEWRLTRILNRIAIKSLASSTKIVVIGRDMAAKLKDLGIQGEKIHCIPNWADTELIKPVCRRNNDLYCKYGLENKFIIMYSGNIGTTQYFDDILTAAERFQDYNDIVFLFIGNGVRLLEIISKVKKKRLKNVFFLNYQNRDNLSKSLSIGDIHFVSLKKGFESLVVPSKTYSILAVGKPILYQGEPSGEIARLITEEKLGFVVQPGDIDKLNESILMLYKNTGLREKISRRAFRYLNRIGSVDNAIKSYSEVLSGHPAKHVQ